MLFVLHREVIGPDYLTLLTSSIEAAPLAVIEIRWNQSMPHSYDRAAMLKKARSLLRDNWV
jgi:hypothetical protein